MTEKFPTRYELKYRLTPARAARLIEAASGVLQADEHAGASREAYTVRSLYFDTPLLDGYHGKLAGLGLRAKLRLRTYGVGTQGAYLELKRKFGQLIAKSRITLPPAAPWRGSGQELLTWLRRELGSSTLPTWRRARPDPAVETMVLRAGLRPIAVVAYERVAFGAGGSTNPRITFDYDVRGAKSDRLLGPRFLRPAFPGVVVLELKFTDVMPAYMSALIRGYGLELESISKYCKVLETVAPFFPSNSALNPGDEGIGFPDTALLYHAPRGRTGLAGSHSQPSLPSVVEHT